MAGSLTIGSSLKARWFPDYVSTALNRPFVILFEQQRTHEPGGGILVGEDTDDIGAPLDLAVEAFERIDGVDFPPMILREGEGQDVGLSLVHERGELRHFGTQLDRRPDAIACSQLQHRPVHVIPIFAKSCFSPQV